MTTLTNPLPTADHQTMRPGDYCLNGNFFEKITHVEPNAFYTKDASGRTKPYSYKIAGDIIILRKNNSGSLEVVAAPATITRELARLENI